MAGSAAMAPEQRRVEARADHGRLLGQPRTSGGSRSSRASSMRLNVARDVRGRFRIRRDPPLRAVTLRAPSFDEAADDLLDEQRVAARALENSI